MSSRSKSGSNSYCHVPAAPFIRLANEWIERQSAEHVNGVQGDFMHPREVLCARLWPGSQYRTSYKRWTHMSKQQSISFDTADAIVSDLLGAPDLWRTNDELAGIYNNISLAAVDLAAPTCEKARIESEARVVDAYLASGSCEKAAEILGIAKFTVYNLVQRKRAAGVLAPA